MREPCCTIGHTGTPGDGGHIPPSSLIRMISWLPKGYGPSEDERLVCVVLDPEGKLSSPEGPHPLLAAIAETIEAHFKAHPEDVTGTLPKWVATANA